MRLQGHVIPISPKQAKRFSNLTSDDRPKKPSHLRPTSHSNQETRGGQKKETWRHRATPQESPRQGAGVPLCEAKAIKFTISYQMATNFTVIAWRIAWTEEKPGRLQSMTSQSGSRLSN